MACYRSFGKWIGIRKVRDDIDWHVQGSFGHSWHLEIFGEVHWYVQGPDRRGLAFGKTMKLTSMKSLWEVYMRERTGLSGEGVYWMD